MAHAPRFWRPAQDATDRHRNHLARLIADPDVVAVRSQHGFLFALDHGSTWLVDDAVVSEDGTWAEDGVLLLREVQQRCGSVRLVVPVFETDRMEAGLSVGLRPVEHWWHRDLDPPGTLVEAGDDPAVAVEGAEGRLVTAPPVYDPGGPVLLVSELRDVPSLDRIEAEAGGRGATVSVLTQQPGDVGLATVLAGAGYVLTTAFCETV